MKAFKTLFAAAASLVSFAAYAQTADEIVNKYVAAMGGAEKLASLKTVKLEGNMTTQGIDVAMIFTKKHETGMRVDMEINGTSNYRVVNNTKGWAFMPVMGQSEPQEMEAEEVKSSQSQLDVQGSLFNYKQKGAVLEYIATEKVEGKDAYKLKMVKNGKEIFYFIDAVSNFIVKTTSKMSAQGQEMDLETSFSDYKQNAEGYWFPYTTTTLQGVITFDKISANIAVDDKIFTN
jgi:hypothetical protein